MGTCATDGDIGFVEKQMEIISEFQSKLKEKSETDNAVKQVVETIREAYYQLLLHHWETCKSSDVVDRTNKVLQEQTGEFTCVICVHVYDNKLNLFMCIQFHIKKIGGAILRCSKCMKPFKGKAARNVHSLVCKGGG